MIKIEIEKFYNGYSVLISMHNQKVRSAFCKDLIEVKDWLQENL